MIDSDGIKIVVTLQYVHDHLDTLRYEYFCIYMGIEPLAVVDIPNKEFSLTIRQAMVEFGLV